jgi:multicomponent Na+:H+ antiporter subunit E
MSCVRRRLCLTSSPLLPSIEPLAYRVRHTIKRVVLTTLLLTAVWAVFSGRFDLLHLGSGILVAAAIALNFPGYTDRARFRLGRFVLYLPWLAVQVIKSNLRVARSVLSPRLAIAPTFISREPAVVGDRALTLLGASTTLTPGTLTVDIDDHEMFVHALDRRSAHDVETGVIAERVATVFEEPSP